MARRLDEGIMVTNQRSASHWRRFNVSGERSRSFTPDADSRNVAALGGTTDLIITTQIPGYQDLHCSADLLGYASTRLRTGGVLVVITRCDWAQHPRRSPGALTTDTTAPSAETTLRRAPGRVGSVWASSHSTLRTGNQSLAQVAHGFPTGVGAADLASFAAAHRVQSSKWSPEVRLNFRES